MSHYNDYMDGVSVKISERYKRPPRIELPFTVNECITRAQNVVGTSDYCTTFENNVLAKIKELRSAKETKKNERKHRLQLLEEEKQKKLDEIAAVEAQEKLKLLSVSDVSYPSTEEISALSPDEPNNNNHETNTAPTQNSPETSKVAAIADFVYPKYSNPDPLPNILQPTQVQANYQQNNLLDDPIVDPLQELKMTSKLTKVPHYSNIETLTFKDFENDTSSPFDNVELKTINEMELLAQVLQSQRESNTSCMNPATFIPEPFVTPNCASQAQLDATYIPNYIEQPVQGPSAMYSPQHYPVTNGYLENNISNTIDLRNMYASNYQYYIPEQQYIDPNYYNNQMLVSEVNQVSNGLIPEPYYFHYPHVPTQYVPYDQQAQMPNLPLTNHIDVANSSSNTQSIKSRSRSVPDIVKELNDEIASAKLRAHERSYTASPAPKVAPRSSTSDKKEEKKHKRKDHLPNPFDKLPPKVQNVCQEISTMGFPLDRVARVCTLVGDSDKKIIEGLLLLGELMDLGFSEGRVSAALAKHEFSKEKALDELVP